MKMFGGVLEALVIGAIILVALLLLYLVIKVVILALPAFILAWIVYVFFGDIKIAMIVFIVTLIITLIKKL